MSARDWDRSERWFHRLAPLEVDERTPLLEEISTLDPALAEEVESLLAAHDAEGAFDRLSARVAPEPIGPGVYPPGTGEDLVGRSLDHYEVLELVGRGGMGEVYRARDTRLEREVALKFLPAWHTRDPSALDRFLVEARVVSAIDHPNVCTLLEMGQTEEGRFFLIMPFYEGETLDRRLRRGPVPVDEAVDIALQVARGLAAAHERGIVHRDVKPSNLLLTEDGTVKVLDFGVAKLADVSLTREGETPGTLHYMAPEQAAGGSVDHRADLWSLGVVLYEMLTGRRPFTGERLPPPERGAAAWAFDASFEASLEEPEAVTVIVERLLSPLPEDRYADAGTVAQDLADLGRSREEARPRIGGSPGRPRRIARLPAMTARRVGLAAAATIAAVATIGFLGSRDDAGIGGWAVWPRPGTELTPEEALAGGAVPGIAVLPFRVNDPALEPWREGMVDLLSVNLDGVPDLRAIDSRTLLARWGEAVPDTARADLATSLAVARRTGARYALIGTVVAVGPDLRLSAELYEARGGTKLGSVQVVGAPDSMLVLVNRLTIEVLRAVPREGNVLADVDLAEVTTNSLDALKDFLSGEALYRRTDFDGAAAAFERAIASDSTFALAWARLRDTCNWNSFSELCGRNPPGWREEHLNRLPQRRADFMRRLVGRRGRERIEALWQLVRKYPDDPYLWYQLGDGYWHYGDGALADPAEGVAAFERAIALAPTTSAEPYIHLIPYAFAEADSAQVARFLGAYGRIAHAEGHRYGEFRLAFALGFGDPATRAQTRAALDTIPTPTLTVAILHLGHPRLHEASQEALRVLLARPDHREDWGDLFAILYRRGKLRAGLDVINPVIRPAYRAALIYRLYEVGVEFKPEELERILAAGAADTTAGNIVRTRTVPGPAVAFSNFLWVGAYAVDRRDWEEYGAALDRQRARARSYLAQGDSLNARRQEAAARGLEGYALWKRGQKTQAIHALETAQHLVYGWVADVAFVPNFTVRGWLGELMLEVGRPRDAERYFKSLSRDPFAALRLGKVYEELGEFDAARAAYEYALLSWQDADPELEPRIQEGRQALARLPVPIRRE